MNRLCTHRFSVSACGDYALLIAQSRRSSQYAIAFASMAPVRVQSPGVFDDVMRGVWRGSANGAVMRHEQTHAISVLCESLSLGRRAVKGKGRMQEEEEEEDKE